MSVEVLISFDTTGSMYPCLTQVRRQVADLLKTLFAKVPGIRLAVLAHGDYGDTWVTKSIDLTTNQAALIEFVNSVKSSATSNTDWAECYELVLREAHTRFTWTPGAVHAIVMIGDATPHELGTARNVNNLDWRAEAAEILRQGFRFYAVQAMNDYASGIEFWKPLAQLTRGVHLELDQFSDTTEFLLAICQHVNGGADQVRTYCEEVRGRSAINRAQARMFSTLAGAAVATTDGALGSSGMTPVPASRFQALQVGATPISIKAFALEQGLPFKTGRGFYELTKPENISDKKEIVLQDVATNDMFTGDEAKAYLGGNVGTKDKVCPPDDGRYRVFVQSTSVSRALVPGSHFLYEVSHD
jgi:hypothetical protein